ncbi:MAG: radical SAM family heme chaperone HemW [Pelagimonas sp.]|nr:radical SAM family heme chaperone HemW [Pelagimonas sp.]
MSEDWQNAGFGLYVHWPFCEAKCPYCDFNSHVTSGIDQTRWANALADEVRRIAEKTQTRSLGSIFFGGGTPSLMHPETVDTILRATRETWHWANDIEITLEANPRSVEAGRFSGYADAGVNRVSLGVQALNPDDLKRLGRLHDVDEAKQALATARQVFDRVSFDLIYARQDQTLDMWDAELREALTFNPDHMSLYQLTIEQGTAFWKRAENGGLKGLPDEDLGADLYDLTQEICNTAGLPAYEVSNHARPGAESRHNMIYWTYGDYAGVGPGAHGRVTLNGQKFATSTELQPGKWLKQAEAGDGVQEWRTLDLPDQAGEYLMMGLRISDGLDKGRLLNMLGMDTLPSQFEEFTEFGLLWQNETALGVTQRGRLVLNALVAELLPDPDH